jgi:16S rRNA (uracil1498-N3)-methyltransferase
MNRIFLSDDELAAGTPVTLSPRYSTHIVDVLHKQVGETLRIGRINGPRGSGCIQAITSGAVSITCTWEPAEQQPTEPAVDLLLALPRPKVLKRLLPVLSSLGIGRLWLTNAEKVEANYFATHWLGPQQLQARLLEGLEQSGETRLPVVQVIRRLKPFMEDRVADAYAVGARYLLHPACDEGGWSAVPTTGRVLLAVGPEGGWSKFELELFENCGFTGLSLGRHILRSDVACTTAIASIRMARRLNR